MKLLSKFLTFFVLLLFTSFLHANENVKDKKEGLLDRPLMERYIIDELRALRIENSKLKIEVERRITKSQIEQTDRAAQYMTDTIGNIFYLIAGATSILVFSGWNSLRDIRAKTENIVEERLNVITKKYNIEMEALQDEMTLQSKNILENQNSIYNNQYVHSLWMRSNLETNTQSRIEIYDEILKLNINDAEAYAYKADAVIDMDEYEWALNLSNKAIEIDPEYGYAYWQRSCANAALENVKEAVSDLAIALEKSPNLHDEIENEKLFESLQDSIEFKELLA